MALKAMGSSDTELLDLVSERLESLVDYLQFSDAWNRVANDHRSRHISPLLLIADDKEDTWNMYSIKDDKVFDFQLRQPNRRFCGSSRGWLITVEENFIVTLTNPFLRGQGYKEKENSVIRLPPLSPPDLDDKKKPKWATRCEDYVFKATISADPILNANDCIVVVIYEEHCRLAFIRLDKDPTWTYIDQEWTLISEVVQVQDRAYGIDIGGKLLTFNTSPPTPDVETVAQGEGYSGAHIPTKRYLVHYNENGFLRVERYASFRMLKMSTYEFKIFELNLSTLEWVEKESLGDAAIFVGDNSSTYVLASNCPGCQSNCIYFNSDDNRICWTNEDCGVYDIETKMINRKPYTAKAMALLRMTKQPPIWLF